MKKSFIAVLLGLSFIGIYYVLVTTLPKNTGFIPLFILLLVADVYLWTYVNNRISGFGKGLRLLVELLYWLPLGAIYGMIITGFFYPFLKWNIPVRAYLMGTVVIVYTLKMIPAVFLAVNDLIRVFRFALGSFHNGSEVKLRYFPRNRRFLQIAWILAGIFFILSILGMAEWAYDFRVRRVTLDLPQLPPSFNGTRIVQISDIHLGNWTQQEKLEVAVDSINALHPDLVFVTGDMYNYISSEGRDFEKILGKIRAKEGIFAIPGNHDYGDYVNWSDLMSKQENMIEMYRFYDRLKWKLLLNEHVIIHRGQDSIAILGVHNWGMARRFQRLGNVNQAAKGLGRMPVQLLLSHDPSYWDQIIRHSHPYIDVTFSGHTHGFQFGIVTDRFKWSPLAFASKEWAGLYTNELNHHRQYLYINIGLGTVTIPGRIGSLPEITLFTLVNRP